MPNVTFRLDRGTDPGDGYTPARVLKRLSDQEDLAASFVDLAGAAVDISGVDAIHYRMGPLDRTQADTLDFDGPAGGADGTVNIPCPPVQAPGVYWLDAQVDGPDGLRQTCRECVTLVVLP